MTDEVLYLCNLCGAPGRSHLFDTETISGTVYTCSRGVLFGGVCQSDVFLSAEDWNNFSYGDNCEKDLSLGDKFLDVIRTQLSSTDYPVSDWERNLVDTLLRCLGTKTSGHFQRDAAYWGRDTLADDYSDPQERDRRFLEESLELVQSRTMSREEAHWLVDYVFDRPKGETPQEVGGVLVTLAILCEIAGIDMMRAGENELTRCWTYQKEIQEKQKSKPKYNSNSDSLYTLSFVEYLVSTLDEVQKEYIKESVHLDRLPSIFTVSTIKKNTSYGNPPPPPMEQKVYMLSMLGMIVRERLLQKDRS